MNQNRGFTYSLNYRAKNDVRHSLSVCVVRFVEEAEAEVVEGDLGEEADSVEIKTEEYNNKGEKM